jgi:hypothetical protein
VADEVDPGDPSASPHPVGEGIEGACRRVDVAGAAVGQDEDRHLVAVGPEPGGERLVGEAGREGTGHDDDRVGDGGAGAGRWHHHAGHNGHHGDGQGGQHGEAGSGGLDTAGMISSGHGDLLRATDGGGLVLATACGSWLARGWRAR